MFSNTNWKLMKRRRSNGTKKHQPNLVSSVLKIWNLVTYGNLHAATDPTKLVYRNGWIVPIILVPYAELPSSTSDLTIAPPPRRKKKKKQKKNKKKIKIEIKLF